MNVGYYLFSFFLTLFLVELLFTFYSLKDLVERLGIGAHLDQMTTGKVESFGPVGFITLKGKLLLGDLIQREVVFVISL